MILPDVVRVWQAHKVERGTSGIGRVYGSRYWGRQHEPQSYLGVGSGNKAHYRCFATFPQGLR